MGCYATRDPAAVRRLPGVAAVIEDKRRLEDALEPFGVRRRIRGIRRFDDHRRAFVKVQDGCILDCSFCIIPKVRPGLLSRQPDDVLDEVRHLTEAGYREIVLTGIHLGHYGVDFGVGRPRSEHFRLWHLLERLAELPGEFRIRLSSLEATEVTDDFVRVFARLNGRVCPFLHLSMQSGSDPVLVRMKRRYRIARFLRRCDQIRNALDEPALATDVIVGFPGETEADFARTLAACRSAGFSKIHIFPFSARRDTEAAGYRDAVAPEVIAERKARLADLERELARDYHRRLLGRRLEMLVQTPDPDRSGWMTGTACRYAPLRLETVPALSGRLVPVRARRLIEAGIEVEPIPDEANGVADMEVRA
jgi:threonylcarbamoyladenosine tRNA methylthiotransferase MtaB